MHIIMYNYVRYIKQLQPISPQNSQLVIKTAKCVYKTANWVLNIHEKRKIGIPIANTRHLFAVDGEADTVFVLRMAYRSGFSKPGGLLHQN